MGRQDEHESEELELEELGCVLVNILSGGQGRRRRRRPEQQITAAGVASLMLGISLTLMLGGSVTFLLGFMLFPWVVAFVMLFYFVGFLSSISLLGRTLLYYAVAAPPPPPPPPLHPQPHPPPPPPSPPPPLKDLPLPALKFL